MQKRNLAIAAVLILILSGIWLWVQRPERYPDSEGGLVITAFAVGKADALLIQEQDTAIVVDTGEKEDGPFLVQELKNRGISRIDLLVVTHFDKDHVGGAAFLTENLEVASVLMPDYDGNRPEYGEFMDSLAGHPDVHRLGEISQLAFENLQMTIYPAQDPEEILEQDGEYDNDMSLVISMAFEERRFLLTGDIEKIRIVQMLASDTNWKHDWIKMPHHGRYQKILREFIEKVQPSSAVICCSEQEPAEEKTRKLLEEHRVQVWDTSVGTVTVTCREGQIMSAYE